jgi:DMSO reductase anchor subunit
MAQVYRLKTTPFWNSWRTNAGFIVSALLLGQSLMTSLLVFESNITRIQLSSLQWIMVEGGMLFLLLAQLMLMRKQIFDPILDNIRVGLILIGMVLMAVSVIAACSHALWLTILICLIVVLGEGMGRWLFYQSRTWHAPPHFFSLLHQSILNSQS